jgi:hypothetical protein
MERLTNKTHIMTRKMLIFMLNLDASFGLQAQNAGAVYRQPGYFVTRH